MIATSGGTNFKRNKSINSLKHSKASSNEQSNPNDAPILVNKSADPVPVMDVLKDPLVGNNLSIDVKDAAAAIEPPCDENVKDCTILSDTIHGPDLAENDDNKAGELVGFGVDNYLSTTELVENENENEDVIAEFMITGDMGVEDNEEYFSEHSFQSFNTVNMLLNSMDVKNVDSTKSDSSKRKSMDVDDDTASSFLKGAKKLKN